MMPATRKFGSKIVPFSALIFTALFTITCNASAEAEADVAADATASEPAILATAITEEQITELYEGDGLEIPLDGTSLEAWNDSLAVVEKHTTAAKYEHLQKALDYLLIYDIGVQRKMELLALKLNGRTGNQVLQRIGYRIPEETDG